jgi:hypothetical protein
MGLLSLGTTYGCSGGSEPGFGQGSGITLEVQLQVEGNEWIGRLRTPGRGDFQLTLRTRDNDRVVTGTLRGRGVEVSNAGSIQVSIDASHPATVDARLLDGTPLRIFGTVDGQLVYDEPSRRITCTSANWILERTGPL